MGTNYYAVKVKPCLVDRVIHIGKHSWGYRFLFRDCLEFHTYPQFVEFCKNRVDTGEYVILNEYEEQITTDVLLEIIERSQSDFNPTDFSEGIRNIDGYRFHSSDFS